MAKMNLIDRAVAVVSPEHALRRAVARQGLEFVNSGYGNYGASTTKKSMRGWQFAGGDAVGQALDERFVDLALADLENGVDGIGGAAQGGALFAG